LGTDHLHRGSQSGKCRGNIHQGDVLFQKRSRRTAGDVPDFRPICVEHAVTVAGNPTAGHFEAREDLDVALFEEGEGFGIEIHDDSSWFSRRRRIAAVADEMPSCAIVVIGCQDTAS
jgi:hypothetical protein